LDVAKLSLKFEQQVLKEVNCGQGSVITIGRLPDNGLQIDNLAVSGHHARVYWDTDHFVVEDTHSLNGTYVNNQRVGKQPLKDNDAILIGKHSIVFKDEWHDEQPQAAKPVLPALPKMEATVVLDTKKAKELLAQAKAASAGMPAAAAAPAHEPRVPQASIPTPAPIPAPAPAKHVTGTLTVLEGKTDDSRYVLSSKLTVIGGSASASIKLKGGLFSSPPDVAAMISKRDDRYYIAPQHKKANLQVNGQPVAANHELVEGDVVSVWKVKLAFSYHE
jgi:hypothetical protein